MNPYLFVYGTLKSDFDRRAANYLRSKSELVGPGKINGALYDLGSYPALVLNGGQEEFVYGEVYCLNDPATVFQVLDRYEGAEYRRLELSVFMEKEPISAWAYEYLLNAEQYPKIREGLYRNTSY